MQVKNANLFTRGLLFQIVVRVRAVVCRAFSMSCAPITLRITPPHTVTVMMVDAFRACENVDDGYKSRLIVTERRGKAKRRGE